MHGGRIGVTRPPIGNDAFGEIRVVAIVVSPFVEAATLAETTHVTAAATVRATHAAVRR